MNINALFDVHMKHRSDNVDASLLMHFERGKRIDVKRIKAGLHINISYIVLLDIQMSATVR